MWLRNKTLLIIAPHLDDEILGCGGLIKRIKDLGGKVFVIFLTNGTTTEFKTIPGITREQERLKETSKVARYLHYDGWRIAFPGNDYHLKLDTLPQKTIIAELEQGKDISIESIKPQIIATTQMSDYNQDHRACASAVITAARPSPYNSKNTIEAVLGYEFTATIASGIEPYLTRNLFITLSKSDLSAKLNAMELYSSQIRPGAHTRSLDNMENLAKLRGAMCGTRYAEAYHIYRMTV